MVAYDTGTGRRRWTTSRLTEHLQPQLGRQGGVLSQMPDGLPFDAGVTLARVGEAEVFLIQRSGGVAAFDRAGGAFRWAEKRTLEQVHLAIAHPFGLVLAGMDRRIGASVTGGDASDLEPRIVVLDPRTGKPPTSNVLVAVAIADGAADAAALAQSLAVGGTLGAGALFNKTRRVEAILLVDGDGGPYLLVSASLRDRVHLSESLLQEVGGRVRYILPPESIDVNLGI